MKTKLLLLLLPFAAVPLAQAGLDLGISAEIRLGKVSPPPPPEVVVVVEEPGPKGPPPWAPAPGFRRTHDYYYYPGANVYYRPADRVWFYLDGRDWRFGASLPTSLRVDFDRSVSLTMATEQPYQFHDRVAVYYPADYFVTKVRVKEKGGKPDKEKFDHADDDSPSKSKGKGRNKNK